MKILLSRTMVNVFDALLKVTIGCLLRIIFIFICKFLNTLIIDAILNGSKYMELRIFSKIANKTILVYNVVYTEPTLFQNLQLLGVNNCRINVIEC